MTDLTAFKKYIELGSMLGGDVGRFFVAVGPYFLGAVLIALIIHGLTKLPPLSKIIAYIQADATKARTEPPLLRLLVPRAKLKVYYGILGACMFSCIIYLLFFLAALVVSVGVWFYPVGNGVNKFGVFALACLSGPLSLFFFWAQAKHINQVAVLIHRVRREA